MTRMTTLWSHLDVLRRGDVAARRASRLDLAIARLSAVVHGDDRAAIAHARRFFNSAGAHVPAPWEPQTDSPSDGHGPLCFVHCPRYAAMGDPDHWMPLPPTWTGIHGFVIRDTPSDRSAIRSVCWGLDPHRVRWNGERGVLVLPWWDTNIYVTQATRSAFGPYTYGVHPLPTPVAWVDATTSDDLVTRTTYSDWLCADTLFMTCQVIVQASRRERRQITLEPL